MKKNPSLWNVTLVGKNNGKGRFLFPELRSFWPAPWIESSCCRPRIMDGQAQFVHSQIYEALQKIRSTVICGFQLWSHLELLIHGTGQKNENKKKSKKKKIDMRVGEKNYYFWKTWAIRYTQNLTHNHLHVHRNKHIVKKIASHWNWEIIMCRTTVVQSEYR